MKEEDVEKEEEGEEKGNAEEWCEMEEKKRRVRTKREGSDILVGSSHRSTFTIAGFFFSPSFSFRKDKK